MGHRSLHEGRKECWRDLELRKFRPRSSKTQARRMRLRKGKEARREEGQKTVEDIGSCYRGRGSELAPRGHRFCQSWCLTCCIILIMAFTLLNLSFLNCKSRCLHSVTCKFPFSPQILKFLCLNNSVYWVQQLWVKGREESLLEIMTSERGPHTLRGWDLYPHLHCMALLS